MKPCGPVAKGRCCPGDTIRAEPAAGLVAIELAGHERRSPVLMSDPPEKTKLTAGLSPEFTFPISAFSWSGIVAKSGPGSDRVRRARHLVESLQMASLRSHCLVCALVPEVPDLVCAPRRSQPHTVSCSPRPPPGLPGRHRNSAQFPDQHLAVQPVRFGASFNNRVFCFLLPRKYSSRSAARYCSRECMCIPPAP